MTRAYRVECLGRIRFATTNATAREAKKELQEELGARRSEATIEEVEIPYGKADLIDWINGLVEELQSDSAPEAKGSEEPEAEEEEEQPAPPPKPKGGAMGNPAAAAAARRKAKAAEPPPKKGKR